LTEEPEERFWLPGCAGAATNPLVNDTGTGVTVVLGGNTNIKLDDKGYLELFSPADDGYSLIAYATTTNGYLGVTGTEAKLDQSRDHTGVRVHGRIWAPASQVMIGKQPEAIRTVGYEGPNAVAGDFRRMSERLAIGDPIGDVFTDAARRVEIADFRFFVVAVNIQRETGGNLAATLDNLADIIRRRRAARQRSHALMSEVRASIAVLTALPFIVLFFIFMTNRGYAMVLFTTERGRMVLAGAIMMLSFGLMVMRWIIKRTLGSM